MDYNSIITLDGERLNDCRFYIYSRLYLEYAIDQSNNISYTIYTYSGNNVVISYFDYLGRLEYVCLTDEDSMHFPCED